MAPRVRQAELEIKFSLEKDLKFNMASDNWGTSLYFAIYSSKVNLVKLLLDAGADGAAVSAGGKSYGKSLAQVAIERVRDAGTREDVLYMLSKVRLRFGQRGRF
ncbi:hypothetical protein BDV11DRAFT_168531 [Aspergillus similis]